MTGILEDENESMLHGSDSSVSSSAAVSKKQSVLDSLEEENLSDDKDSIKEPEATKEEKGGVLFIGEDGGEFGKNLGVIKPGIENVVKTLTKQGSNALLGPGHENSKLH